MKILVICMYGQNRSRRLAEYLTKKGYDADYAGANSEDVVGTQKKIDAVDVVITVHDAVREKMLGRLDVSAKRHIELTVEDRPENVLSGGTALDGDAWYEFQRTHVYPKLEEQIERYLPF